MAGVGSQSNNEQYQRSSKWGERSDNLTGMIPFHCSLPQGIQFIHNIKIIICQVQNEDYRSFPENLEIFRHDDMNEGSSSSVFVRLGLHKQHHAQTKFSFGTSRVDL